MPLGQRPASLPAVQGPPARALGAPVVLPPARLLRELSRHRLGALLRPAPIPFRPLEARRRTRDGQSGRRLALRSRRPQENSLRSLPGGRRDRQGASLKSRTRCSLRSRSRSAAASATPSSASRLAPRPSFLSIRASWLTRPAPRIVDLGPRVGLQTSKVLGKDMRAKLIRALMTAGVRNVEAGAILDHRLVPQVRPTLLYSSLAA
jgi:hypothetical protein